MSLPGADWDMANNEILTVDMADEDEHMEARHMEQTAALARWVVEFDKEKESFPSPALFCEHKMRATLAVSDRPLNLSSAKRPLQEELPSRMRIAKICLLHTRLLSTLDSHSDLLGALHMEMMKAIYHKPEAVSDWRQVDADGVVGFTPYFMQTHVRELPAPSSRHSRRAPLPAG